MIHVSETTLIGNEEAYVFDCLRSTRLSMGPFVQRFEEALRGYAGRPHALAVGNGTMALHLAVLGLGLRPGRVVLVPSYAYVAVANAVQYCGARPIPVDVNERDWNINPYAVEQELNRWRGLVDGIIVVHTYGLPCDMKRLQELATEHKCWLVEDAAEAIGATLDVEKNPAGSAGNVSTFSFYGNKIISCGEGGAVLCSDPELHERMRMLRGQGQGDRTYWHPIVGYNYRMSDLHAAVGLGQLELLDIHLRARRNVVYWYGQNLSHAFVRQLSQPDTRVWSSNWMFAVLLPVGVNRAEIIQRMHAKGIETRPGFTPLHKLPMYAVPEVSCPVAEDVGERALCLPTHAGVQENDVQYICTSLQQEIGACIA